MTEESQEVRIARIEERQSAAAMALIIAKDALFAKWLSVAAFLVSLLALFLIWRK
jgi:hypothetical protein